MKARHFRLYFNPSKDSIYHFAEVWNTRWPYRLVKHVETRNDEENRPLRDLVTGVERAGSESWRIRNVVLTEPLIRYF
jgi:hypothetical protein